MIIKYKDKMPSIHKTAFIAESACIAGDVKIKRDCSVWFSASVRGDQNSISLGERSNIQDNCVLHVDSINKCNIGKDVSIGHGAIVHGCNVSSNCIIGMGSIILSGAKIGKWCIIGAGSVVTEGKKIPSKSLVIGTPGKIARKLTSKDIRHIRENAKTYLRLKEGY
jgi:carbonic anhydrase/acetyltransferase-like protein (isoleucine patch superfamily)